MKKILFVCHGNICRSPMAEFVMKDLVKKLGWHHNSKSNRRLPAGRRSATRSILRRGASYPSTESPAAVMSRGSLRIKITTNTTC